MVRCTGRLDDVRHLESQRSGAHRHLDHRRHRARRTARRDAGTRGDRCVAGHRRAGAGLHARGSHLREVRGRAADRCREHDGRRLDPLVRPRTTAAARRSAAVTSWNAPIWLGRRSSRDSTRSRCRRSTWPRRCSPAGRWEWSPADSRSTRPAPRPTSRRRNGLATVRRQQRACTSSSPRTSGASTYQGSGDVPGTLLNQYAMSEYDGVLRVASTVSERRGWVNTREVTEGMVTTLHEQDGTLRQLGQVGGLGRQGQRVDPSRAVHRGARVRRHVPSDRSAVRARPSQCCCPEGPGRAEDPRLLGLPASDRREPAARCRSERSRRQILAPRPACSSRCSTSATRRPPAGSTRTATVRGRRPPSSTPRPFCTGSRAT